MLSQFAIQLATCIDVGTISAPSVANFELKMKHYVYNIH